MKYTLSRICRWVSLCWYVYPLLLIRVGIVRWSTTGHPRIQLGLFTKSASQSPQICTLDYLFCVAFASRVHIKRIQACAPFIQCWHPWKTAIQGYLKSKAGTYFFKTTQSAVKALSIDIWLYLIQYAHPDRMVHDFCRCKKIIGRHICTMVHSN